MISGMRDGYYWIVWPEQNVHVPDLINAYPEIAIGKYAAIPALDPFIIRPRRDWYDDANITYSPLIQTLEEIPLDEWWEAYFFLSPHRIAPKEVFFPYGSFSITASDELLTVLFPHGWYKDVKEIHMDIEMRFWEQLNELQPHSYLQEGDLLNFATRDAALFEKIREFGA